MADTNLLVLAREYKKLREEVKQVLQLPKGDTGAKGEKGDTGDTGPQGFPGRDGKDGINGYAGKDGSNGKDGQDGKDGLDGVGVQNAYLDFDNALVIVLTDGREINAGYLDQEAKEAVVATFKQGASTINELLPPQTGNANKFLKTNGTDVSWDTLDGSDINLASPPPIGGTTPAAGTFTTLTATGQTSLGGAAGAESFRAVPVASSAQYIAAYGAAGQTPYLVAEGANANINLALSSKGASGGASNVRIFTNGLLQEQLRVSHTASAVNYVQVTGSATNPGGSALANILFTGSDASVNGAIVTKGTGYIAFAGGATTGSQALRVNMTNAVSTGNLIQIQGAAAGSAPSIQAISGASGTDTNIDLTLTPKGTGLVRFGTYTANMALTIQGYVEIKDSGGTIRRLAVIA